MIETLLDEDTWAGTPEEIEEAYGQVNELFTRFVDAAMMPFPIVHFAPITVFKFNGALNPWLFFYQDAQFLNGVFYQTTGAQGDWWTLTIPLKAGSYQWQLWGMKYNNAGKTKVRVNGVYDEGSLFDWYSAAAVNNVVQARSMEIAQDGEQVIDIFVPEKNALSSGYYVLLSSFMVF